MFLKNIWNRVTDILGAVRNRMKNKENQKAAERLKICQVCPRIQKGICTKCGCVVALKVFSEGNTCPEAGQPGRWKE